VALLVVQVVPMLLQNHAHAHTTVLLAVPYQDLGVIQVITHVDDYLRIPPMILLKTVNYLRMNLFVNADSRN